MITRATQMFPVIIARVPMRHKPIRSLYLFRVEGRRYAIAMIDLKNASRDDLIRLIVGQHETIQQQGR
ncbi:MAG: hypothetical protein ACYDAR_10860, partial [Thermomicrobiales bacterium]